MLLKKLFLMITLFTQISSLQANSCTTVENGKVTLCNNYAKSGAKFAVKQKSFCSKGDLNMAGMIIKNTFKEESCPLKAAIAKCRNRDRDVTIYYSGDMADLKKGCKVFKSASFIKL
jgi:hypothetical protein